MPPWPSRAWISNLPSLVMLCRGPFPGRAPMLAARGLDRADLQEGRQVLLHDVQRDGSVDRGAGPLELPGGPPPLHPVQALVGIVGPRSPPAHGLQEAYPRRAGAPVVVGEVVVAERRHRP